MKAMNHVGLSVANLDRSIEFYQGLLGMQIVLRGTFEGEQYARVLGLAAARGQVALLSGLGMRLELFEFSQPLPRPGDPYRPVCDHGITHFCLEVDDLEAQYQRLNSAGVRFHCPPATFFGKIKATYGRDPDGNVFELCSNKP